MMRDLGRKTHKLQQDYILYSLTVICLDCTIILPSWGQLMADLDLFGSRFLFQPWLGELDSKFLKGGK